MINTEDTPKRLMAVNGLELIRLLNELALRARPLDSMADNVYLHYHADGVWRVQTGFMLPEDYAEWQRDARAYDTLAEALEAALQEYREFDVGTDTCDSRG